MTYDVGHKLVISRNGILISNKTKKHLLVAVPSVHTHTPRCPRQPRSQPKHTAAGPQHRHPHGRSNQQDSRIL